MAKKNFFSTDPFSVFRRKGLLLCAGTCFLFLLLSGCNTLRQGEGKERVKESTASVSALSAGKVEKKNFVSRIGKMGIVNRTVTVYASMPPSAEPAGTLQRGTGLFVSEAADGWFKVRTRDVEGWVDDLAVSFFPIYGIVDPDMNAVLVTEGEDINSEVVGGLTEWTFLEIEGMSEGTYSYGDQRGHSFRVSVNSDTEGWVFGPDFSKLDYFFSRVRKICESPFPGLEGSTRDDVYSCFGTPDRVVERKIQNIHYKDVTDTIYEMHYGNLVIQIYHANTTDKEFLTDIVLTGGKHHLPWNLSAGKSASYVEDVLGPPHRIEGGAYVYTTSFYNPEMAGKSVNFTLEGNTVRKIEVIVEPL